MKDPIVSYGFAANGTTYVIQKHNTYYTLWFIDSMPADMSINGIEAFIADNCNDGWSVSGDYQYVIDELASLIASINFT